MADVFISYSHKDKDFVLRLSDALKQTREAWVDWKDIPPTAEWQQEILENIERADNFVFVISPDSVVSPNCRSEIAHAEANNKRMVPILYRAVRDDSIPEPVGKYQRIDFADERAFGSTFEVLVRALDTDLVWTRAHTRLLTLAKDWEQGSTILLRGKDLLEAEQWIASGAEREPGPTPLHSRYILASQQASLDAELDEPAAKSDSPLDMQCRDRLEALLPRALAARYESAQAEIRRRLSGLCRRAALKAQLAPDRARLAVAAFPGGARVGVGYRDRIVIADGASFEPLYTHPLDVPAVKIRMRADPLVGETMFVAVESEHSPKITYYGIPSDGSSPVTLPSPGEQTLLEELVRQFANTKAKADSPQLRLPDFVREKEHGTFRVNGAYRVPLIVGPEGKTGLWLALDTLTVEKKNRFVALLRFSAKPVLKIEDGEITEIAPEKPQGRFQSMSLNPSQSLPLQAKYEVAALDVKNRVTAVRDRLVSFPTSGAPAFQKLPFTLEEAVSADFNADATELLVQQKDGSLDVYDVARQSITHRFPVVANARCIAPGPRQESAIVVYADGLLETWDLKAFGPDGSAIGTADVDDAK